jgi:hypothetical protein
MSGDHISGSVTGDVSGQVAVGKGIEQHAVTTSQAAVTDEEMSELRRLLAALRENVKEAAPPESQDAALDRVDELEEELTSGHPDSTTLRYLGRWFTRTLPGLAGLVTALLIHPIVGKIVQEAGEAALDATFPPEAWQ